MLLKPVAQTDFHVKALIVGPEVVVSRYITGRFE